MANLDLLQRWRFETTTHELRLITKALDERLREDEKEEARELAVRLTTMRVSTSKNVLSKVEELENNVNAAAAPGTGRFGPSPLGVSLQQRLTAIRMNDRAAYHVWQIMERIVVKTSVSELCAATQCETQLPETQTVNSVVVAYSPSANEVALCLDTKEVPINIDDLDGTDFMEPIDDLWDESNLVPYITRLNEILELIRARY